MHQTPPEVDFESSRSPAKSESGNNPSLHLLCCVSHITILPVITCMMNVRDQTRQAFVTRFCPFCCDRTSKIVHRPQNISSPIRAKYRHFRTICEHTFDALRLWMIVGSFYLQIRSIFPHISLRDLPCHRTLKKYADFPSMAIFQLLLRKFWIQTWFCNCQQYLSHCL